MNFETFLDLPPYSLSQPEKERLLLPALIDLTVHHCRHCPGYARIVAASAPDYRGASRLADLPFLPVSLFKTHDLKSVPDEAVTNRLTSSGTGGAQSQIAIDAETANRQALALTSLIGAVLGPERLPMIVIDSPAAIRNPAEMSARGAGILGLMRFGRKPFFALDDAMALDIEGLKAFLGKYGDKPFFLFGFTFMVWRFFLAALPDGIDLSNGILLHGGGWKRLQTEAVDNAAFKQGLKNKTGLARVHNFYGMVEQLGGIYLEGPDGYLHPPMFGDVLIRDIETWEEAPPGRPGLIQLFSTIPLSYPGHALLTEDIGVLHQNDGKTGEWGGKAISVLGRAPRAVLRGCSDAVSIAER